MPTASSLRRVLLVDDDADLLALLVAYLPGDEDVTTAGTAAAAMTALAAHPFDVVVSDLNLEEPDEGLWVLAEAQRLHPRARCVLITGSDPPDLPGILVLPKPFGPQDLQRLLE